MLISFRESTFCKSNGLHTNIVNQQPVFFFPTRLFLRVGTLSFPWFWNIPPQPSMIIGIKVSNIKPRIFFLPEFHMYIYFVMATCNVLVFPRTCIQERSEMSAHKCFNWDFMSLATDTLPDLANIPAFCPHS